MLAPTFSFARHPRLLCLVALFSLSACHRTPLEVALLSDDQQLRSRGLERLKEADANELERVSPILVQALSDQKNEVVQRAQESLVAIGAPAVKSLGTALDNPDPYIRMSAADILGKIGSASPQTIPLLQRHLNDPHPLVREEVAAALIQKYVSPAEIPTPKP